MLVINFHGYSRNEIVGLFDGFEDAKEYLIRNSYERDAASPEVWRQTGIGVLGQNLANIERLKSPK